MVRLGQHLQQLLETVSMLVHLTLLLEHFDLFLVDKLLNALKFGKVLLLVLFYECLQSGLSGRNLAPRLLLRGNPSLLLRFKLLTSLVFRIEQILDDFALLLNLCIDAAEVVQKQIDPMLEFFSALAA